MSEEANLRAELDALSHEELLEVTQSSLRRLLASDSLLSDLPTDVTTEEVLAQIAVAQGQSITVTLLRNTESPLPIVIPQNSTTVRDLKKTIQRTFWLRQQRLRSKTKISWSYIWKTYDLKCSGNVLSDDREYVSVYGIRNKSEIEFVKKLRENEVLKMLDKIVLFINLLLIQHTTSFLWLDQVLRQEELSKGCKSLKNTTNFDLNSLDHLLVDHKHKFLYCYVPKVACTNWKRVFMVLTEKTNVTDLMSIPADLAHNEKSLLKLSSLPKKDSLQILNDYTTFLMVRHPFERLLSAYRNKLVGDSLSARYFQVRIGKYIIKSYRKNPSQRDLDAGDNVTFKEFVRYLLKEGSGADMNEHWKSVNQLCFPCNVNYTFIGKYERFEDDSKVVLSMIGAPNVLQFPQTRSSHTGDHLRTYFATLSLEEIRDLYRMYEADFKMFGYNLESVLGYEIG
nr:LOW QUALITY PROTEIN: carbohydrate sulfotransferase 11-like [Onthophagus taurus]